MRGTGRIILGIFGLSSLVVFYVHLQVGTFLSSYEIHRLSEKIHSSTEEFRKLKFEIDQYKAPHLLEGKIRDYEMNLALPEMVYHVPNSFLSNKISNQIVPETTRSAGVTQFLLKSVSGWVQVAHAKSPTPEA